MSGSSWVVRAATADEVAACTALWVTAVATRDGVAESDAVRARAAAKFAVPRVAVVVAVPVEGPGPGPSEGDALLGFALVTAPGTGSADDPADAAYLSLLAVSPSAQGRGLGRALLDAAVGAAGRSGHERCLLHALDDNEAALRLYRSAGFRPVGPAFPHPLSGRATRSWVATAA